MSNERWSRANLSSFPAKLLDPPYFGRERFKHTLKEVTPYAFDDLYDMNTQSSSQWDGFRHASPPMRLRLRT